MMIGTFSLAAGCARQHEVENHQVVAHALHLPVHRGGIRNGIHREALLPEVALEQVPQAQVVVDDEDLLPLCVHAVIVARPRAGCRSVYKSLRLHVGRKPRGALFGLRSKQSIGPTPNRKEIR